MLTVNLHTHSLLPPGYIGLVSHPVQQPFLPVAGRYYSVGLHPWALDGTKNEEWLAAIERLAVHPQVAAIGECGLDRAIGVSLRQQTDIFMRHIEIAERHGKPLIIHSVRAMSEMLGLKRARRETVPWVLHGYGGNAEMTRQLVEKGFYLSFGVRLLNNDGKVNRSLLMTPRDRLFFETDDSDVPIEDIYALASSILSVTEEELKEQTYRNFLELFPAL